MNTVFSKGIIPVIPYLVVLTARGSLNKDEVD